MCVYVIMLIFVCILCYYVYSVKTPETLCLLLYKNSWDLVFIVYKNSWDLVFIVIQKPNSNKVFLSYLILSTAFIVKFCNMPRHASHKTPKPFLGELLPLLLDRAVLNSSIFWHFGLRWLIFRPIKSHTCSIGFMSGDIAGHGIVWTASCCKKCCTIRALCGLALLSMNIGLSANAWL